MDAGDTLTRYRGGQSELRHVRGQARRLRTTMIALLVTDAALAGAYFWARGDCVAFARRAASLLVGAS